MLNSEKASYLIRSALNFFQKPKCSYCGGKSVKKIASKYIVTKLVECNNCKLRFRMPQDSSKFNFSFYQKAYKQSDGITTDLPTEEKLSEMINNQFEGTSKNIKHIKPLFEFLYKDLNNIRLIDFGCNWGYTSYQFSQLGMKVQSYEISEPRADFGKQKLGLSINTKLDKLQGNNDVFFSSHVIEHVPSIKDMITKAKELINEEGYFIAYCPNGSNGRFEKDPIAYHKNWGLVHPNYLSDQFFETIFKDVPYLITSNPYDFEWINKWDKRTQVKKNTTGFELLVVAKINKK